MYILENIQTKNMFFLLSTSGGTMCHGRLNLKPVRSHVNVNLYKEGDENFFSFSVLNTDTTVKRRNSPRSSG